MTDLVWANATVTLGQLKPWANNPRFSTKAQAKRLLASWKELGQFQTVAIGPECEVYDGHQRLSALLTVYGADYKIDARQSSRALTDDERKKLVITAHVGAVGSWDWNALSGWDAPALKEWGMDADTLKAWNTDATNLKEMLKAETAGNADAEPQIDRAAELLEKWQVKTGDLWRIGEHRLLCGDSTKREDVARVMGGEKADAVITDPPYAFGLASTSQMAVKSGGWHDMMNNADWFCDLYKQWREIVKSGPLWVFSNWRTLPILMRASFDSSVGINSVMVWYKDWIGPGGIKALRPTYELISLTILGDYVIPSRGVEDFVKVGWSAYKPNGHDAEKPAELIEHLVKVSGVDVIFEPFAGSGTCLVACQSLGKKCLAGEISPAYCAVILERMASAFPDLVIERVE